MNKLSFVSAVVHPRLACIGIGFSFIVSACMTDYDTEMNEESGEADMSDFADHEQASKRVPADLTVHQVAAATKACGPYLYSTICSYPGTYGGPTTSCGANVAHLVYVPLGSQKIYASGKYNNGAVIGYGSYCPSQVPPSCASTCSGF